MPKLYWKSVSPTFAKTECNTYQVTVTRKQVKENGKPKTIEKHTVYFNKRERPGDWGCLGYFSNSREVVQFCQSHHDQKTATETKE